MAASTAAINEKNANFADSPATAATDVITPTAVDLRVPTVEIRCLGCPLVISGPKPVNFSQGVAFVYVGPYYLEFSINPYSHRCQGPLKNSLF